jgi:hypothetical protein
MDRIEDARGLILESVLRAAARMEKARFRGYDPYDALSSPLFRHAPLRHLRVARFGAQQVLKRMPINIRPLLGIPKGYNPVTLAFALQGSAYLACCDAERAAQHRLRAELCRQELIRLRSPGYSGDCWGYDFDWEARYASFPAYTPTVVATGFVSNALFTAYRLLGDEDALALCRGASQFVLRDLNRTPDQDGTFCWSYSPIDHQVVLNASMKGARICAQVFSVTRERELAEAAGRAVRFVSHRQDSDGRWPYALGDKRSWADNFHTGYVLDCFDEYERCTGDRSQHPVLQRGWGYYRRQFVLDDEVPKYYDRRLFPIDANACAQTIMTLCRFGDLSTAMQVALWTISNMQAKDGAFTYRIQRRYSNRTKYMRWSTAPMLCALAALLHAAHSSN